MSIIYTYDPLRVVWKLEPIPLTSGERQGAPWAGHQSVTGLKSKTDNNSRTFIPTGSLEYPLYGHGKKPEHVQAQKGLSQTECLNPEHSWCEVRVLTSAPLCHHEQVEAVQGGAWWFTG